MRSLQPDEAYLCDLKRIRLRAQSTMNLSGPMGSWLLDKFGPKGLRGRFSLMWGVFAFAVMLVVGLHQDLAGESILQWCLLASAVAMVLGALLPPWPSFEDYLASSLRKCSDDPRLVPMRELIGRQDLLLDDKLLRVLDQTTIELGNLHANHSKQ